jgi:hypothetical protein
MMLGKLPIVLWIGSGRCRKVETRHAKAQPEESLCKTPCRIHCLVPAGDAVLFDDGLLPGA